MDPRPWDLRLTASRIEDTGNPPEKSEAISELASTQDRTGLDWTGLETSGHNAIRTTGR
ncbi:MAG: hypothetical protein PWR07_785 [Bacillota bacterium]|nr:hypothetical protein [Bacillota bacterium]